MKIPYFLSGTLLGLVCVPAVAYWIMRGSVWGLIVELNFLIPVLFGYFSSSGLAFFLDFRRSAVTKPSLFLDPLLFSLIFEFGVIVGCLANYFINGDFQTPQFGWRNEAWSWFGKPAFALSYIGIPFAFGIGFSYSAIARFLLRLRR